MFKELSELLEKGFEAKTRSAYCQAYGDIFLSLVASQQQQMNQLLSVNCVFVCALHRLYGPQFFASVCQRLWKEFSASHSSTDDLEKTKVKNILNCYLHFYLFQSLHTDMLFSLIKFLLNSFTEDDVETLIFLLHNVGLNLRQADPENLKSIIDIFTQKRNSYLAESKLDTGDRDTLAEVQRKSKERKLGFLHLEL